MGLVILLVATLAGARTWQLLNNDEITMPIRDWLDKRSWWWDDEGNKSFWQRGFECPFCLGFWLTSFFVVTGLLSGGHLIWLLFAGSLAANYLGGHLNAKLD